MARTTKHSKKKNHVSGTLHRKRPKPCLIAATFVTLTPEPSWWLCVPLHCVVTLEAAQALQLWFIIHFISSGNVCPPVTLIQPSALT